MPLTFPRRLLPLLVNAEGKRGGRKICPLPVSALMWSVRKKDHLTLAIQTEMWDRLYSFIIFGLISSVRLLPSSENQTVPVFTLSNCRGWEQSLPFSWKPAQPGRHAVCRWSSGSPAPVSSIPGSRAKLKRKEKAVRVIKKNCQKQLREWTINFGCQNRYQRSPVKFQAFFSLPANPRLCWW